MKVFNPLFKGATKMDRILITGMRIKITIKCFLNNEKPEGKT